jgi:hypothetical protein
MKTKLLVTLAIVALAAPSVMALSPGTEHFVPGAVRGQGRAGAFWMTDLTAFNPNAEEISVDIYWLPRGKNNAAQQPINVTIPPYTSVTVPDVIKNVLGQDAAAGGFRIVADGLVAGSVYVYDENGPYGVSLEATPIEGQVAAEDAKSRPSVLNFTNVFGIEENSAWRTNFLGVGTDPNGTLFDLRIFDANGEVVLDVQNIPLKPWETQLWELGRDLGLSDLDGGFMEMTVTSGAAIFAATRVSNWTNDGQVLEQWVLLGD